MMAILAQPIMAQAGKPGYRHISPVDRNGDTGSNGYTVLRSSLSIETEAQRIWQCPKRSRELNNALRRAVVEGGS